MKQKLIDLSFVFLLFFIGLLMAEFHAWAVNKFLIPEFYRIFKNGYWSTFWGSGAKWSLVGLVFKMLLIWIPFMFVGTLLFIFNSNDSKIKTWATWILLIFFGGIATITIFMSISILTFSSGFIALVLSIFSWVNFYSLFLIKRL